MAAFAAAKRHKARGVGVELNRALLGEARAGVEREGLSSQISLSYQDAAEVDVSGATVVTLYLSERGNAALLPRLRRELPPGARVVSFCWPFPPPEAPAAVRRVDGIPVFLYKFR